MANQLFGGSICISDLMDMAKKGHSAFSKSAKNGKVYCNILVWQNEEVDEYGNSMSLQLSSEKDKREAEKAQFGKGYIGNAKKLETKKPVSSSDIKDDWQSKIPTRESSTPELMDDDGLPF